MGWLDDGFDEHLKVQLLPDERAAWLYVRGLLHCRRNPKSRGRIAKQSIPELTKMPRPKALAAMLATDYGAGVLWEDEGPFYKIHDWEILNERAVARAAELDASQDAARAARSAKAQKAAAARWSGHAPSNAQASPSIDPSNAQASVEQCSDDASRARGRAPDPVPIPASPSLAQAPVGDAQAHAPEHARLDAQAVSANGREKEMDQGKPQVKSTGDPLAARWFPLFPRRQKEAGHVLTRCRQWFDDAFTDEGIGHVMAMDPRPRSPRYLLTLLADWSQQRGIYPGGHPVYAQLVEKDG